jgi:hypothetical protein
MAAFLFFFFAKCKMAACLSDHMQFICQGLFLIFMKNSVCPCGWLMINWSSYPTSSHLCFNKLPNMDFFIVPHHELSFRKCSIGRLVGGKKGHSSVQRSWMTSSRFLYQDKGTWSSWRISLQTEAQDLRNETWILLSWHLLITCDIAWLDNCLFFPWNFQLEWLICFFYWLL